MSQGLIRLAMATGAGAMCAVPGRLATGRNMWKEACTRKACSSSRYTLHPHESYE